MLAITMGAMLALLALLARAIAMGALASAAY